MIHLRHPTGAAENKDSKIVSARFTVDGSDALESHLAQTCQHVLAGVQSLIPLSSLDGIVLGGGYGRGQGGVFKSASGDLPYNDLEFYVFTRGNVLLNERHYRHPLHKLGDRLSPTAGLHVEFKVYSRDKLRRAPVSMFTYDLAAGHRIILGDDNIFQGCEHHLRADQIPLHEATRLLFNRCSGLLLAKDFLRAESLTADQTDFIVRNLAKAQLAFGDALLTVRGQYHWSCRERHDRLNQLTDTAELPTLREVRRHHAAGVEFKLHPRFIPSTKSELESRHAEITELGRQLWLWLESLRFHRSFTSARDYAFASLSKCPETSALRNAALNLKTFGPAAIFGSQAFRYPRERLLNALSLLLWDEHALRDPAARHCLKNNLRVPQPDWPDLLRAYQHIWQSYG
jgi:hypothetical protein